MWESFEAMLPTRFSGDGPDEVPRRTRSRPIGSWSLPFPRVLRSGVILQN